MPILDPENLMETGFARPIAFLLYDSRSGSTLFSALLNQYAPICVSQESAFISRVIEYPLKIRTAKDAFRLLDHLDQEVHFTELGMPRSELEEALGRLSFPIPKQEIIASILTYYFQAKDPKAEVWVIKYPPYSYIPMLRKMFPGAKFIHIIRDGRAVYSSKKSTPSIRGGAMEENFWKAALKWRKRTGIAGKHPGLIFELRYEDLVRQPETWLEKVLDFLEVPPEARTRSKTQEEYYQSIGAKQKSLHAHVAEKPDVWISEGWKSRLDEIDLYLYEKINGKRLISYGYPLMASGQPHGIPFYLKATLRLIAYSLQYLSIQARRLARRVFTHKNRLAKIYRRLSFWFSDSTE